MSYYDYSNGLGAGMAARNAVVKEYSSAIDKWEAHAHQLQKQLDRAEESKLFMTLQFKANDYVLIAALEELRRVNPNSPLLNKINRDILRRQQYAQALMKNGYQFDPSTNKAISKVD